MRSLCLMAILLVLVPASEPQNPPNIGESGNVFMEACKNVDRDYAPKDDLYYLHLGRCLGWLEGFSQGVYIAEETREVPRENAMFCPSSEVRMLQFFRIVKKFTDEHPERTHQATRYLAAEALARAFPCKK